MSTTLTNGIIIPDNGSRNWGGDLANNWNIIDVNVGYMNDVKNKVTTLETSVAENTTNIQINTSNISALQTSKQDKIEDLETIRTGASAGATAVQPSTLNNYATKSELSSKANDTDVVHKSGDETINGGKTFTGEIVNTIPNSFRHVFGNYAYLWRNDGEDLYLLLTNSGDPYGIWNNFRPLVVNFATGICTINGKTPAYAYDQTMTTVTMHVGSVLTNGGKSVSFVVPINVDSSPAIEFARLRLRSNGYYLFGSTGNSDVTTSYTFTATVFFGGINILINFSDTDAQAINNSCIVSEITLKLTY